MLALGVEPSEVSSVPNGVLVINTSGVFQVHYQYIVEISDIYMTITGVLKTLCINVSK